MPSTHLDIAGFLFQAKGVIYPIAAGYVETSKPESGEGVNWNWEMALELKKSDVIPSNEITYILWPDDHAVFLKTQVLSRRKEGHLTIFKLVPYLQNVIVERDE